MIWTSTPYSFLSLFLFLHFLWPNLYINYSCFNLPPPYFTLSPLLFHRSATTLHVVVVVVFLQPCPNHHLSGTQQIKKAPLLLLISNMIGLLFVYVLWQSKKSLSIITNKVLFALFPTNPKSPLAMSNDRSHSTMRILQQLSSKQFTVHPSCHCCTSFWMGNTYAYTKNAIQLYADHMFPTPLLDTTRLFWHMGKQYTTIHMCLDLIRHI